MSLLSARPAGAHPLTTFLRESDLNGERHAIESASRQISAIKRFAESGYSFAKDLIESIYSLLSGNPENQKNNIEALAESVRRVSTP